MRTIKQKIKAQKVNMGGIILDQALPVSGIEQIDPILLIHHWKSKFKPNKDHRKMGVGPHPHRGFAPVTFIFEGALHHRDSEGNSSIIEQGGTQWMNSGSGIVHSERPPKDFAQKGGDFEIIQFWINAPKSRKMDSPNYQPLTAEDTPQIHSKDKKIKVGVVAGELQGIAGKIDTYSPLLILRLDLQEGGEMQLDIPQEYNALWYQLRGNSTVNNTAANVRELLWFENDDTTVKITASESGKAIILAGKPLNEPLATHGPFVMNTQAEIMQAIQDYQSGKMGVLNEKFD